MNVLPILWTVVGIVSVVWLATMFLFSFAGFIAKYVNRCKK